MSNIYGPILPLQLDSRNTDALARAIQTKIFVESEGKLNDFSPASPLSAISEGQAFAQAELLYYLNNLPEAFTLQWFRQLGIQRKIGSRAFVDVTFVKTAGYSKAIIIPANTQVIANNSLLFLTTQELIIAEGEFTSTVTCRSEQWGSAYNVPARSLSKIDRSIVGLGSLFNAEAAEGGSDLESIDEMKSRAFGVLSRRNLTTLGDFEAETRLLAPDANVIRALTYEERNRVLDDLSGHIVICVGNDNGKALSTPVLKFLVDSMTPRITAGSTISFIAPEITPVDIVLEVMYDPNEEINATDFLANTLLRSLREVLDPLRTGLGTQLNYQDMLRSIYLNSFVKEVNRLEARLMIRDINNLHGPCGKLLGDEVDLDDGREICVWEYSDVIDNTNQTLDSVNPIQAFKLFRAAIALTSINDFSSLTFFFEDLYPVFE